MPWEHRTSLAFNTVAKSNDNSTRIATDIAIKLSSPELHTAILNKSVFWEVGSLILENEFKGVYALKVIDVLKQPQLAEEDKILATPTLAKILPPPVRRIIGDLSDREKVLIGLDLLFDELTETEYSGNK